MKIKNLAIAGGALAFVVVAGSIVAGHEMSHMSATSSAQSKLAKSTAYLLSGSMARLEFKDIAHDINIIKQSNVTAQRADYEHAIDGLAYGKEKVASPAVKYYLSKHESYYINVARYGGNPVHTREFASPKTLLSVLGSRVSPSSYVYTLTIHNKPLGKNIRFIPRGGVGVSVSVALPLITHINANSQKTTANMLRILDKEFKTKYGLNESGNTIKFTVNKDGSLTQ